MRVTDSELEGYVFDLISRIAYWSPEEEAEFARLSQEMDRRAISSLTAQILLDSSVTNSSIAS